MQVIIMRGIPGSGKSTYVRDQLATKFFHGMYVSADDFFICGGTYRFDPKRIGEAHASCLRHFVDAVKDDCTCFVDNTNTTAVEIAPYYALALAYRADVKIVHMVSSFEAAVARNTHDVPVSTIWKMQVNILTERLPPHWTVEYVFPEKS